MELELVLHKYHVPPISHSIIHSDSQQYPEIYFGGNHLQFGTHQNCFFRFFLQLLSPCFQFGIFQKFFAQPS
jgi:hypothetical protein